jgi:hypothetical protein
MSCDRLSCSCECVCLFGGLGASERETANFRRRPPTTNAAAADAAAADATLFRSLRSLSLSPRLATSSIETALHVRVHGSRARGRALSVRARGRGDTEERGPSPLNGLFFVWCAASRPSKRHEAGARPVQSRVDQQHHASVHVLVRDHEQPWSSREWRRKAKDGGFFRGNEVQREREGAAPFVNEQPIVAFQNRSSQLVCVRV